MIRLEYPARGETSVTPFPSHLVPRGESGALADAFVAITTASAADDLRPIENALPAARAYAIGRVPCRWSANVRMRTSGMQPTYLAVAAGASREHMDRTFTRAFLYLLPSDATFVAARAATLQAARDLYGVGSAVESAISEAWDAVGVK